MFNDSLFNSLLKASTRVEVDKIVAELQRPDVRVTSYVDKECADYYDLIIHAVKGPYYKGAVKMRLTIGGNVLSAYKY